MSQRVARRPARVEAVVGESRFGLLLVLPVALVLLVTLAYPIVENLRLAFTNTNVLNPRSGPYIGLQNFADLLTDPQFGPALWTTIGYTICCVLGTLGFALSSALIVNSVVRGRTILRSILMMPWAAPSIAVVMIFSWMLDGNYGVISYLVSTLTGGGAYTRWLLDPSTAMPTVIAITIWKIFPFSALVILAALQSVPDEALEASQVDGASALNRVREIVLPAIMPTILILAMFTTIWSFRRFELIWLLTGGGPLDTTNTLVVDLYRESFVEGNLGLGAAKGMVGLAMSTVVAVVYLLVTRRLSQRYLAS